MQHTLEDQLRMHGCRGEACSILLSTQGRTYECGAADICFFWVKGWQVDVEDPCQDDDTAPQTTQTWLAADPHS